jgi:hypothetical protein
MWANPPSSGVERLVLQVRANASSRDHGTGVLAVGGHYRPQCRRAGRARHSRRIRSAHREWERRPSDRQRQAG